MSQTTTSKIVKLYPYSYVFGGITIDSGTLKNIFSKLQMKDNIIPYSSEFSLLLVIDGEDGDFLKGCFMKLRTDSPTIINIQKCDWKKIRLTPNEDIAEISYFIWNVADKRILAQYNFSAIRYFRKPLEFYWDSKFKRKDSEVYPISNVKAYEFLKKTKKEIKLFRIGILRSKMHSVEKVFPMSTWERLRGATESETCEYELVLKKGKIRDSHIDKEFIFKLTDELKEHKEDIERLIIETSDGSFNLVDFIWVKYRKSIRKDGKNIDAIDFYDNAIEAYNDNRDEILSSVK